MDDDVAIKVEHVSKKYCKSLKRSMLYGIKDIGRNTFGLSSHSDKLRADEFWAVDDISFEMKKGETLGIIGPNGSGKTTLLKMLNGIFWPDKGKITVKGRVGALIEVGAGFHPMLTGRENIYINAAILGMTKEEVDEKFDEIVDFADIGDFIDTPVKFYSSGMFVRLGFAVAVHSEPDILLIDEILAVGDTYFQNKCLKKISKIKESSSVVLVSHNLNTIKLMSDYCILLHNSKQVITGEPSEVLDDYSKHVSNLMESNSGSNKINISITDKNDLMTKELMVNKSYKFLFNIKEFNLKQGLLIAFRFVNLINNYSYRIDIKEFSKLKGIIDDFSFTVSFERLTLPPGLYTIRVAVSDGNFLERIFYVERTIMFEVKETNEFKFLNPKIES